MSGTKILSDFYGAFGRGEIDAALGAMAKNIRWHQAEGHPYMPSGDSWLGPEKVLKNLFSRLITEWDDFAVHTDLFHDAGEVIVVEGRYTARHKKSGKDLNAQFCHVWSLKNSQIVNFQQYTNTLAFHNAVEI